VQGPENRDELQPELHNTIPVRFIPIFGANTNIYKGIPKKDIPMFFCIEFLRRSFETHFFTRICNLLLMEGDTTIMDDKLS